MRVDSLGFRTDLDLLRMGGSSIEDCGDHLVIRSPHNPGHHWGNFVLLERIPPAEDVDRWIRRFAEVFPDAGRLTLGFDGTRGTVEDLAAFTARGSSAEAQVVMTAATVGAPVRPDTSAIHRPLVDDEDWEQSIRLRLRCNASEPAYDRTFVTAKVVTQRRLVEAGHGTWFGAFLGGRLVAQLGLFRTGAETARFQSVETDPDFRRRGLAGTLLWHAGRRGADMRGTRTLVIVADPEYVAIDLYRTAGFRDTETQCQVEGPG